MDYQDIIFWGMVFTGVMLFVLNLKDRRQLKRVQRQEQARLGNNNPAQASD